jgi:hypothetical protein
MSNITLDLEKFTSSIQNSINRTLGWVSLQPSLIQADEISPPSENGELPQIMLDPVLIESDAYKFDYTAVRFARFNYLLERGGGYEVGELLVLHDLVYVKDAEFEIPLISYSRTVLLPATPSDLGVELSFIHDPATSNTRPQFGLAYRITSELPEVFPKLNLTYMSAISLEKE